MTGRSPPPVFSRMAQYNTKILVKLGDQRSIQVQIYKSTAGTISLMGSFQEL